MLKSLRAPERLFAIASWVVTLVFAGFLIGLGGKVVGELPGVDQSISIDRYVTPGAIDRLKRTSDSVEALQRVAATDRERANNAFTAASNAYQSKKEAFDNWIATRTATTDPKQDPEVIRRTRELDTLQAGQRSAERVIEEISSRDLALTEALQRVADERQQLYNASSSTYQKALFGHELRVFGIRLLITFPLLLVGWWLFTRKRKSQYWPLARGFILFALFAFFFELVPYLPSYGGYVRYIVGIVLTAVVGHYLIRAMQRYIAKRAEVARQTENERRESLGYEEAIKKMSASLCPGCERPVPGGKEGATNFCVHCGMMLFDHCPACTTRKNAFYQYCPSCGVGAKAPLAAAVP